MKKPSRFGGWAQPNQNEGDMATAKSNKAAQPNQNEGGKSEDVALPASVKLAAPHGFICDETNVHHYWHEGQEVTDPDEIALLIERQAPLE